MYISTGFYALRMHYDMLSLLKMIDRSLGSSESTDPGPDPTLIECFEIDALIRNSLVSLDRQFQNTSRICKEDINAVLINSVRAILGQSDLDISQERLVDEVKPHCQARLDRLKLKLRDLIVNKCMPLRSDENKLAFQKRVGPIICTKMRQVYNIKETSELCTFVDEVVKPL